MKKSSFMWIIFYCFSDPKSGSDNSIFFLCRGPPGDLYVYLNVEEIEGIQRDGINLCSTVSISYLDAILGAIVKVSLLLTRF